MRQTIDQSHVQNKVSIQIFGICFVSIRVNPLNRIVETQQIKVSAAIFFNRIPADPAAEGGGVVAVAVVVEVGFGIVVLRREAVRKDGRHRAGRADRVAEGVVGVLGDDGAEFVPVADDVAVVVVGSQARLRLRLNGASRRRAVGVAREYFVVECETGGCARCHGIMLPSGFVPFSDLLWFRGLGMLPARVRLWLMQASKCFQETNECTAC